MGAVVPFDCSHTNGACEASNRVRMRKILDEHPRDHQSDLTECCHAEIGPGGAALDGT